MNPSFSFLLKKLFVGDNLSHRFQIMGEMITQIMDKITTMDRQYSENLNMLALRVLSLEGKEIQAPPPSKASSTPIQQNNLMRELNKVFGVEKKDEDDSFLQIDN